MFSGNVESTVVIIAVIVLNAVLGTVQHVKAEKSLASLKPYHHQMQRLCVMEEKLKFHLQMLFREM